MPTTKPKLPGLFDEYTRATADCPCPICARPDWCLVANDGKACICSRVKSRQVKRSGRGTIFGWRHWLGEEKQVTPPPPTEKTYLSTRQLQRYIGSITNRRHHLMIERQADLLGLKLDALLTMRALYDPDMAVLAFPMLGADMKPLGVRFRRADGRKWSLTGGREGVLLSRSFTPTKPVWIAEGPTDSAALVQLGLRNVIGRPNCMGGDGIIKELLASYPQTPVVIVSDPEEAGRSGAGDLANVLPNPTIVIVGNLDIRDYLLQKTRSRSLTRDPKCVILEGLTLDEEAEWTTLYRNRLGRIYDFSKVTT